MNKIAKEYIDSRISAVKELKGIVDESVFGKAVIFVSNNTLLDRNELAERYIQ